MQWSESIADTRVSAIRLGTTRYPGEPSRCEVKGQHHRDPCAHTKLKVQVDAHVQPVTIVVLEPVAHIRDEFRVVHGRGQHTPQKRPEQGASSSRRNRNSPRRTSWENVPSAGPGRCHRTLHRRTGAGRLGPGSWRNTAGCSARRLFRTRICTELDLVKPLEDASCDALGNDETVVALFGLDPLTQAAGAACSK